MVKNTFSEKTLLLFFCIIRALCIVHVHSVQQYGCQSTNNTQVDVRERQEKQKCSLFYVLRFVCSGSSTFYLPIVLASKDPSSISGDITSD